MFLTIFCLLLSIILTFSIAAYPVWIRCTLHDVTVDISAYNWIKLLRTADAWEEGILQWRYYIPFRILTFAKPSCDNVLQPSPLRGSGCNTLSHSGLANLNIRKRMFYPLIIILSFLKRRYCQRETQSQILFKLELETSSTKKQMSPPFRNKKSQIVFCNVTRGMIWKLYMQ